MHSQLLSACLLAVALAPFSPKAWSQSASTGLPMHTIAAARDVAYLGTITLDVDATDLDRRVFQVRQRMPVKPGPLTLLFPRWLPGTHGPTGNVNLLAGLQIQTAAQQAVPCVCDTTDPYAFHLTVPAGTSQLDLAFQHLSPLSSGNGRVVVTREMLNLQWNSMLLYPAGHYSNRIQFATSVKLPAGWQQASALQVLKESDKGIEFAPVNLEKLVDSPLFAGQFVRRVPLEAEGARRPVTLNIVADSPDLLQASDEQLQAHKNLVQQADLLFGARHFERYNFLLSISERMSGIGLEHHESSENGVRPSYFKDWAKRAGGRDLLAHEYVHSWNGKFRRPADLTTNNFNEPMRNSLLWLYEGQTQFWGKVLAVRSGLITQAQARDNWAQIAGSLDARAGRTWRNLQDTTNEGTMSARGRGKDWSTWQRSADYYDESALIWLDADSLIREKSNNTKSMDDFARAFFGMEDGRVAPLPYTFDDIVKTLNAVQPHDWQTFLRTRLDTNAPGAPLDGLARAGWKLTYADKPSEFVNTAEGEDRADDYAYSLGISLGREGRLTQVLWSSPAFKAGLTTALQLIAINGRSYKPERLSQAITANKDGKTPLALLVKEGDEYRTITIDYRDGLRYPRLERMEGSVERLEAGVLAARKP